MLLAIRFTQILILCKLLPIKKNIVSQRTKFESVEVKLVRAGPALYSHFNAQFLNWKEFNNYNQDIHQSLTSKLRLYK